MNILRTQFVVGFLLLSMTVFGQEDLKTLEVSYYDLAGIGPEEGVMRRDPSDIIKVDDLYYVWYSKGNMSSGYNATVWYATSPDGQNWTEQGMALAKGKPGTWEGESVFTPNIMVAEGQYWLFYSGVSRKFKQHYSPDTKIGIAVSDSPNGPWKRLPSNPALTNSDNLEDFDSHLVDDACLVVRDGKYWFYYKGRQMGKGPGKTKMGVAIAEKPEGPYVKYEGNPIIQGNHEVLVWPESSGVAALIGTTGPPELVRSVLYSEDGLHFTKTLNVMNGPVGGGAYRPNNFADAGNAKRIEWGVEIQGKKGFFPFIHGFKLTWPD